MLILSILINSTFGKLTQNITSLNILTKINRNMKKRLGTKDYPEIDIEDPISDSTVAKLPYERYFAGSVTNESPNLHAFGQFTEVCRGW